MVTREWRTGSAAETIAVGGDVVALLQAPALVLLEGTLGAGKTTLMKGVVAALGAAEADQVTSPTFTLVHEYAGELRGGAVRVFHLDLYRIESERELLALGLDEMLAEADALVFVEWGEKFASLAARASGVVRVEVEGEGRVVVYREQGTARAGS